MVLFKYFEDFNAFSAVTLKGNKYKNYATLNFHFKALYAVQSYVHRYLKI